MRIKSFILAILVLVFLFLSSSSIMGEESLPPLSVDKETYIAEDTVTLSINIDPSTYSYYYLNISALNNSYAYKGDFNPLMFFYPTEEGVYTTALVEKSTGAIFYSVSFNVIAKKEVSSIDKVISGALPLPDNTSQIIGPSISGKETLSDLEPFGKAMFVSTDKKEYLVGEAVRVFVSVLDYSKVSLYHSFNGVSKKYMGDLMYINFVPQGVGEHELILKDSQENVISSHIFKVNPSSAMRILRIINSKGVAENIEAVASGESLGFGSFDVLLNKSFLKGIKFRNLRFGNNLSLGVDEVAEERIIIKNKIVVKSFAIDPAGLNFSDGTVTATAVGTELWKCEDWNFVEQTCYGSWVKVMDIVPGTEYSFILTPDDPGFAETSPTTGTADIGNVINIANIDYIDGSVNDTQLDDRVYWAAGVDNPGNRRNDPSGYLNITYNISAIGLSSASQIFELNFNISYCHSSDVVAPTTCAALSADLTYLVNNVEVYNYTSGTYYVLGTLPLRDGASGEGSNNYTLNFSLSNFVWNNTLINIRYGINFSILRNGVDAVLAVDYATLTVTFDKTNPKINFVLPTDNSSSFLSRNYILVNVSANDTNLKNITIYLYNASGALVSSQATTTSSVLFYNFTGLSDGLYYFNATTYDAKNNFNFTETRNVTLDTTYPRINYSTGTEQNNTYFNRNWVFVNVSVNETNEVNITFRLYNITGPVNVTTLGAGNRSINFTNLDSNMQYWYNVTIIDVVGFQNSTQTRKITLDSTFPLVNLQAPGNDTFRNNNSTQFNYTPIDNNLASCILYANFTAPFGPNQTHSNPVSGSINTFGPINLTDGKYLWNVWCNDSAGNSNFSQYNYTVKIDVHHPVISDWARNGTGFPVNSYICLNVSVTDNFAGVQTVYAEVQNPNSIIANYTLLDNGAGCDAAGGDNIYSVSYYNEFAGNYTWINTYAKDYSNNWHTNLTNLTWNATSTGSMTVLMVYPSSSIEINESEYNYQYQQTCNVSCDAGGVNCENITLYAQYQPLAVFFNINTTTTDLINAEDNFSCGSLVAGGAPCTHTFNITSGTNSGNHTWPIRCSATSESIGTFVSSSVNLIINDHPHANFTYPANNAWLGGVEMLNASASFDSDGTITNYWFEYDNNSAFSSPATICNSLSINCTWDTSQQNQCDNNTLACYLRLIVTDDNGLTNSTYITIGFDTQGPTTTLDLPRNSENISSNSFSVNATASDGQVGVHTVTFEYRQNDTDSWHFACSDSAGPPYNCTWDLTSLPDRATYEFRAYSNDSKGNTGSVNTHTNISLNRSAPVITLISPPDNSTDTDGYIIFTYQVAAFNPIINCSLIINNNRNQTNDSVQRGQNQYFYLSNVPDGSQLNWSINCTDTSYRINFSDTWNVTVAINTNMNLSLLLDKSSYYIGEVAVITNNVTEPSGSGISSVDVSTAIVLANTTIPWWNSSWQRRKPIILNSSSSLTNVMVEVNITGLSGNITGCANEIMIVRFNSSTALLTNVNRTIVGGDNANYCVVRFRANITAGVNNTEFMAYYNNSGATNPNNNESWQTLNSTKTAISGSILGSQYNVNSGSYSNTTSDDNSYYGVGRDNSPPTGQPLNAFLNLTYNLSNLGVPESSLVSLNFTINYCHSNDVTAPITCGSAIGAGSGTAYVQLYDYDAVGWAAGFDTILQDVNSANEITDTYIETNALDNYVDNSTNMLFVRYETNITGLGKSDDASFALDHAILNVFYKERVYSVGSIGSTQLLVASNSSTTDYQGLWVWNWSTTGISAGNYSTVSLGTKANYNNAYDYFWFEIKPDNVAPIIMLVSPQNNNYTTNNNMTFYFNVSDATSAIANCSLIINGNIVNTTLSPPRDTNLSLRYDLGNGVYNWSVNCTDINNNVNSSEIRNLTIAPALNIALIVVDDNIFIPINEIDLQAGTTKTVYCNMTVTDSEVYTNILGANATLYSTTTAYDSGDSNRTHYTNSSCAFIAGGGQSADYQCIFNVWYFAINGSWNCTGFAWTSSFKVNATGNTTMNQLFALNISTSVIDYTSLEPSQFSPNVTVNISNVGNMPMNISVYGFGGEDEATGTGLSMVCEINNITVSFERFATSPATDYNSKTQLGAAEQDLGLTIPAKTAYDEIRSNSTYWQFMVPAGSQSFGQCNGSVVFVAESP